MGGYNNPPYYLSAYSLAVSRGFKGTLDDWLESLKGAGVELRNAGGKIQWRIADKEYGSEDGWRDLLDVSEIQNAVDSANRAEDAAKEAEASLKQIEEILDAGVDTGGISYFGWRYADAEAVYDLNDEKTVKMYLFPTGDGYDAVVAGEGEIANYTEDAERGYDVKRINRLHIEKGVTSIGDYFVYQAYNLKNLSFADSKNVAHIGNYSFAYTPISGEFDFSGLEDTKLEGVFRGCRNIEGVTLSEKVAEIAKWTFYDCASLKYVDGLTGVTKIGYVGFEYCTCLESVDLIAANIELGDYAFMLTPNDIKLCKHEDISPDKPSLTDAEWKSKGIMPIVQNEWDPDHLAALREYRPADVRPFTVSIPEMDQQDMAVYANWRPIIQAYSGTVVRNYAYNACLLFAIYHAYNIIHPDAPYDTFYDFVNMGINAKKIKVTESLHSALANTEIWEKLLDFHKSERTGITYTVGDEIVAFDLPITLNFTDMDKPENNDYDSEGSLFWGIFQVLGWSSKENYFGTFDENRNFTFDATKVVALKQLVIDEMNAGRPVNMEIVGRDYDGHGAHAVVPINYDAETDRFLIIDSASAWHGAPESSVIPNMYWLPFEALITPNKASSIRTFDFGEAITMTQIDENLKTLLQTVNSGFRVVKGTKYTISENTSNIPILCFSVSEKPQLFVWKAKEETAQKILNKSDAETVTTKGYIVGGIVNFAHDFDELSKFKTKNPRGIVYTYKRLGIVDGIDYGAYGSESIAMSCSGTYENEEVTTIAGGTALGVSVSFPTSFEDGSKAEIEWTAYYWNE